MSERFISHQLLSQANHAPFSPLNWQALSNLKIGEEEDNPFDVASDDITISYLAARNPFVAISETCSLNDLGAALVERHCHRVPIVDKETGKCVNIISQSALVKYLAKNGKLTFVFITSTYYFPSLALHYLIQFMYLFPSPMHTFNICAWISPS